MAEALPVAVHLNTGPAYAVSVFLSALRRPSIGEKPLARPALGERRGDRGQKVAPAVGRCVVQFALSGCGRVEYDVRYSVGVLA